MSADNTIEIGRHTVCRIGLGTNRLTDTEGNRELLRYAFSRGLNFIDTAHIYTSGESERTIGAAFSPLPEGFLVATKGGYNAGDADTLRRELTQSLTSLRTETVTLYQLHRVDAAVPLEETLQVLKQFQDAGQIEHIGLSNATVEQVERARQVAPVVSVQNEYNLSKRGHEGVLEHATRERVVFIPFFPLRHAPAEQALLEEVAPRYDATPTQVALAWLLKRSPMMLPIPGTLSREHLDENLAALEVDLSDDDFEALGQSGGAGASR